MSFSHISTSRHTCVIYQSAILCSIHPYTHVFSKHLSWVLHCNHHCRKGKEKEGFTPTLKQFIALGGDRSISKSVLCVWRTDFITQAIMLQIYMLELMVLEGMCGILKRSN